MAARLQRLRRGALSETFPFAGPAFRRAAPWLLALVAFGGLLVRLVPTLRFGVWGSDEGEYLFLTQRLVDTGRVSLAYDGWGLAYPYFPGLFVVSGAVSAVVGVDVFHAVLWTTPILSALMPVLVALLAYRVTSDPRVGIVAGAFIAVTATVTVTTSHAMPGTLGQVLLLFVLALLPDAYRDRKALLVLLPASAALVLTHHLTTYFLVGMLAAIPFYRELTQRATDVVRLRVEIPLAGATLVMAAVWWLGVAAPFRDQIVGDALPFPPAVTVLLFLLALASLPAIVTLKRRRYEWFRGPKYPRFARQRTTALATGVGLFVVVLFAVFVKLPGSSIRVSPLALLFILPVLAFLSFLPLGVTTIRFHRQGILVLAALYAVLASLAFAVATSSRVFFPFRHVDYMVMMMAPLAAAGMIMVYDQTLAARIPSDRPRARAAFVGAFVLLILVSAAFAYPPREVIGGFEEGIGDEELTAIRWVAAHHDVVPQNATIAADHRDSSLLFGIAGLHPTWDYTPVTYHSENVSAALAELSAALVPANHTHPTRVDYVFLSPQIEQGVTLTQWENSEPMSAAAIAKFDDAARFEKLYDVDGVRIYHVLWPAPKV